MCRRKIGVVSPEKMGAKNFYICSVLRQLPDLMAKICWTKRDIDNRERALQSTKGLLRCLKISWTSVHKRHKTGPEFLPTLTISFCPTWRLTATLDETALGSSAAQIWSPKKMSNWKSYRVVGTILSRCSQRPAKSRAVEWQWHWNVGLTLRDTLE